MAPLRTVDVMLLYCVYVQYAALRYLGEGCLPKLLQYAPSTAPKAFIAHEFSCLSVVHVYCTEAPHAIDSRLKTPPFRLNVAGRLACAANKGVHLGTGQDSFFPCGSHNLFTHPYMTASRRFGAHSLGTVGG